MAKNNQRDPNLRAETVARVNQLVKGGLTKAGAFEKISEETGRAKDAVQMLYYRAIRAAKGGSKSAARTASKSPSGAAGKSSSSSRSRSKKAAGKAPAKGSARSRRTRSQSQVTPLGPEFPALLNGIANAINALLKHVEKTVEENRALKEQAERLKAITSLIRGR